MAGIQNLAIKFESDALPANTLVVTRLTGEECLSTPFRFELDLMSRDATIDLEKVLYAPARLGLEASTLKEGRAFRWFHGALESLTELDHTHGLTRYHAVLRPDLWRLGQYTRSRIFQNKTIDEMVGGALEADLELRSGQDFEFRLSRTSPGARKERAVYPEREYVVQYDETDLSFVSRWLEQEGIFYFFENDGTREKVVFADAATAYKPASKGPALRFHPEGGGGDRGGAGATASGAVEEVTSFVCVQTRRPGVIRLVDYNWRTPAVALTARIEAQDGPSTTSGGPATGGASSATTSASSSSSSSSTVAVGALGVAQAYSDNFRSVEEGKALANVRLEQGAARSRLFQGKGTCRAFRPGRTFSLAGHFRSDFDAGYVLISVRHEADQAVNFDAGTVTSSNYKNSFEAMPKERTFRPARLTPWPQITGTIHAFVDSAGEGDFADLDDDGRYLLRIPFDERESDQKTRAPAGYASRRVRMAQPYAGVEGGFHFPLLKGTEVLLTHIDGDPDRPVIAAAVPNARTPSPTHRANHTQNRITTTSGNAMVLDDDPDLAGYVFIDTHFKHIRDLRHPATPPPEEPPPPPPPALAGLLGGGTAGEPGAAAPSRRSRLPESARRAARGGPPIPPGLARRAGLVDGGRAGDDTLGATAEPTTVEAYVGTVENRVALWAGAEAELTLARGKVQPDEPSLFAPGYKFQVDEYDSTVAIDDGLKVEILNGARYKYDNCAPCVTISTADGHAVTFILGDQLEEKTFTGKLTEVSEHTGDKEGTETFTGNETTTGTHTGDKTETSTHIGNVVSTSTHVGDKTETDISTGTSEALSVRIGDDSKIELFGGRTTSLGLTVSNAQESSITLGSKTSSSVTIGTELSTELTIAAKVSVSMTLGSESKTEISAAGTSEVSISMAAKSSISMTLAAESAMNVVLAAKSEINMTLAATSEIGLFLGAKSSIDLFGGVKSDIGLVVGVASEINLFLGGQIKIDLSASILLEIAIAAATGLKINISADGCKEINIPKKTEISLEKGVVTLKHGKTVLMREESGVLHTVT